MSILNYPVVQTISSIDVAAQVTVVDSNDADVDYYVILADGATGSQATESASDLRYNADDAALSVPVVNATTVAATTGNITTVNATTVGATTGNIATANVSTQLKVSGLEVTPVVPAAIALAGTATLSATVSLNVLRPTADATIAAAVVDLPASPVDGQVCEIVTTAEITVVTGTLSSATLPAVTTLSAGGRLELVFNTAAGLWFSGK
jgi:hypothetical protein